MKKVNIPMLAAAILLAVGVAAATTSNGGSSTKTTSHSERRARSQVIVYHESGTIGSLNADQLVLNHTWQGKPVTTAFSLHFRAKEEESNLKQGESITVTYHLEDGQRVATNVRPESPKLAAEARKS